MKLREIWILSNASGLLIRQLLLPGFAGMANNGHFGKIAGACVLVDPAKARIILSIFVRMGDVLEAPRHLLLFHFFTGAMIFFAVVSDDPTLADGILDRLVHNADRIEMRGDSMRKNRGKPNA